MTPAINLVQSVESNSDYLGVPIFQRLSFQEDLRRLAQFRSAKPSITHAMASRLGAYRQICLKADVPAYNADMAALDGTPLPDVKQWLALSGLDGVSLSDWYMEAEDRFEIRCTEDDYFTSDAFVCDHLQTWHSAHAERIEVVVRRVSGRWVSEHWCEAAVDEEAFHCDVSDRYYASGTFDQGETAGGSAICAEWADANSYWVDDGYWTDRDPHDDSSIPSYHDASRYWSMDPARSAPYAYYGLEVELAFPDEEERQSYYDDVGFPLPDLTAERDGSLDEDGGLEVVSRPFTLSELRRRDNPLWQAMRDACDHEASSPSPAGYGVHVTVNAQRLSVDHRRRLVDATYDMRALTEFVAGRRANGEYFSYRKDVRTAVGKYTAINERSDGSYEFRVFQGTPHWPAVLSYVEYVDALTEWTRNPANPTRGPVGQALFRAWAASTGCYPELARRFTTTLTKEAVACALPLLSRAA